MTVFKKLAAAGTEKQIIRTWIILTIRIWWNRMQDIYADEKTVRLSLLLMNGTVFSGNIKQDKEAQEKYLDFLRDLLKDKVYVFTCVYDGYSANQKIWNPFCIEYV